MEFWSQTQEKIYFQTGKLHQQIIQYYDRKLKLTIE